MGKKCFFVLFFFFTKNHFERKASVLLHGVKFSVIMLQKLMNIEKSFLKTKAPPENAALSNIGLIILSSEKVIILMERALC